MSCIVVEKRGKTGCLLPHAKDEREGRGRKLMLAAPALFSVKLGQKTLRCRCSCRGADRGAVWLWWRRRRGHHAFETRGDLTPRGSALVFAPWLACFSARQRSCRKTDGRVVAARSATRAPNSVSTAPSPRSFAGCREDRHARHMARRRVFSARSKTREFVNTAAAARAPDVLATSTHPSSLPSPRSPRRRSRART